jgi:TldD protein
VKTDPFDIPIEQKVALLLAANEAALKVQGSRFVNSAMFFLREEKTYANSEGSFTVQTIYRASPTMTVTAVSQDFSDFQSRQSTDIAPMGRGYEHVLDAKLVENAPRWAEEAVQKLSARPVDVGRYDLVLHPTHLGLTIHESIAHPTELDRVYGYEANYAGTSFVSPRTGELARLVVQEAEQTDALARLLVRPVLGRRAIPAHAQRVAAAGRKESHVGRPHRRHRSRHRDRR